MSVCQENRKLGVHSLVENYRIIKSPVKITDKVNAVFGNTYGQSLSFTKSTNSVKTHNSTLTSVHIPNFFLILSKIFLKSETRK